MGSTPLLDRLLEQVRNYCDASRGRRADLARYLEIRPHMLTEWLNGSRAPGGEYTLQMQVWLKANDPNFSWPVSDTVDVTP